MNILPMLSVLRKHTSRFQLPLVNQIIQEFGHDPYLILISCLLSLRARDATTIHICRALFSVIKTPAELLALPQERLEVIIKKSGYYRVKAAVLRHVSLELMTRFAGKVPHTYEELIAIKGIGPKTANLVLGMAYGVPSICVDTHVHKISNRLGLIKTNTVAETELVLQALLPLEHWIEYNFLLVMWGQNICVPISPKCSQCPLRELGCQRVGVLKSR